jgi:beta-glucosidase
MVLLKNDKGLLPLDAGKVGRLAVLGTHARDTPIGGYSDIPRKVVSVLEGLQAEAKGGKFQVDYAEAVRLTESRVWAADEVKLVDPAVNARLIGEAVEVAKKADVVLMVLGDNEQTSREAWADNHLGDRNSLDLIGQQNDLARAIFALGKPTVVLLLNGRPLSVNLLAEKADAILEGWYLGQETGNAVADVVFGRANPGGKLPVSIARDVGQLPIFYNRKPTARRGYLFGETSPLYPFGFGLSYTTFEIGAPRPAKATIGVGESLRVEVDVTNTGGRAGDEVVQIYLHDEAASVTRPLLELKKFQRVTLAAGEKKTLSFELTPADLAIWNIDMKRVVEPGKFTVMAGGNSADLKSASFVVSG